MNIFTCYIGIGSNLGDRQANINSAIQKLKETKNCSVEKISPVYETEPQDGPEQGKFLNGAIKIETALSPLELLGVLKNIESRLGRLPSGIKWSARAIDLDILLYDDVIFENENLAIPHPLMHTRWFVLRPLCDIAGDIIHPVFKKSINELLNRLEGEKCQAKDYTGPKQTKR